MCIKPIYKKYSRGGNGVVYTCYIYCTIHKCTIKMRLWKSERIAIKNPK